MYKTYIIEEHTITTVELDCGGVLKGKDINPHVLVLAFPIHLKGSSVYFYQRLTYNLRPRGTMDQVTKKKDYLYNPVKDSVLKCWSSQWRYLEIKKREKKTTIN